MNMWEKKRWKDKSEVSSANLGADGKHVKQRPPYLHKV